MRTKYFPIISIGVGILFIVLFFMFYNLVFKVVYDILHEQNMHLLTRISKEIEDSGTRLKQESGALYASRGVRRKLKLLSDLSLIHI